MKLSKRNYNWLAVFLIPFCLLKPSLIFSQSTEMKKPNIVFILADDLGYGDIGIFFQNSRYGNPQLPSIHTPNIDALATQGGILTNHYAGAPVCAPSRASLFSGRNQGQASVRNNQFDKALSDNHTLGTVLRKNGYNTALIGKWGLQGEGPGPDWPAHPSKRGFDYFLGYIRHEDGHEHYPKEGLYRGTKEVYEDKKVITSSLDKSYTGDLFTAAAKNWILNQRTTRPQTPFFLFLSYDTPHAVLELPTQAYPDGFGLKGGLKWLGQPGKMINTAYGEPDSYFDPRYENAMYDHDSNPETDGIPWPETYKRYATIVSRIDNQVGDLVALLKDLKLFDNTMIVFTSDNGPSKESYLPENYAPNNPEFFQSFGPFEGIKRDLYEGGMREPTIVTWPKEIKPNTVVDVPSAFYDWMTTFCDAIGVVAPVSSNGTSFLENLKGDHAGKTRTVYSEYYVNWDTPDYKSFSEGKRGHKRGEMQLLRMGDTLGIRYNILNPNQDFQFYNIREDPSQRNPLELANMDEFQKRWKTVTSKMRYRNESALRPYDAIAIPSYLSKNSDVVGYKFYSGDFPWVADVSTIKSSEEGEISSLKDTPLFNKGIINFSDTIYIPESGRYEFKLKTDNPVVVKMYQISLIDADFNFQKGKVFKNSLLLEKGYHPINLYYQNREKGKPNIDLTLELME